MMYGAICGLVQLPVLPSSNPYINLIDTVEDNTLGQVDLGPNVYPDSSRGHTGPLRQPY